MKDAKTILEFDAIKSQLKSCAILGFTKQKIDELDYSTDYYFIEEELEKTNEALSIVNSYGRCPIEYFHNIVNSVDKAVKQGVLSPEELYRIGSQALGIIGVKNFYNNIKDKTYSHFEYFVNTLHPLKTLKENIDRCITPSFEIYDHASGELARIRKDINSKNIEIRRKLESIVRSKATYLSEFIITVRNDRLVVPVKSSYKNSLNGIIHDESSSSQTVYIEPESVILLNSQISSLKQQEAIEIEKILRNLSKLVSNESEILLRNQRMIGEIDFMFAKGIYGISMDGVVARLSKEQVVNLKGARHPLLDKKTVVANDFYLGGTENKIYLITGPNTGGKTVAMKTVGLLALMNQCGLAIPCDFEAELGIFESFFADIGDEQSIEQSLSTFSSHISKLTEMVENIDSKSLVLIDEVGGGTDPQEGEAIAMAVIEEFHRKNAIVLATTHYANLKSFAIEKGYITNASMKFDNDRLVPTYKLLKGVSGKSYAFEIATNLGFPKHLIDNARNHRKHYMSKSDELIDNLENELLKVNKLNEQLQDKEQLINQRLKDIELEKDKLDSQTKIIEEKANQEIEKIIFKAELEIEELMKEVKNNDNIKLHNVIDAKSKLSKIRKEEIIEDLPSDKKSFEVGDFVMVVSVNKRGKIERKNGNEYLVNIGGLSLKVDIKNLRPTNEKSIEYSVKKTNKVDNIINVAPELNLIGKRVDEALDALDNYLDQAMRVRLTSVRIIHGFGTGALRKAIHAHLKTKKYIKDFHFGGAYDGGGGATIVVLRD